MSTFNKIVLSAIRGGEFEAELLNDTGYVESSLSGRIDYPPILPGVIVVWIDADRSVGFANALKNNPGLPLSLVSNYGNLPCTVVSISGWPPIRIELQPDKRLRASAQSLSGKLSNNLAHETTT
jgi:hypothetical protein